MNDNSTSMIGYKSLFFIICISLVACNSGDSSSSKSDEVRQFKDAEYEEITADTLAEAIPPPPPVTQEKDSIQNVYSAKSPFLEKGCCSEEGNRLAKCCCEAVLEEYKVMTEQKDPKLGEYKMTDPILGKCRKKMIKAFDLIDNPPKPEGGDDDYEDLI